VITSEYPPQTGGVADYVHLVAAGLAAAGDSMHVWCPASDGTTPSTPGVIVHRDLGAMGPADLRRVGRMLSGFPSPRHLLVQWVPHGYGYRAMNLPFCLWLWGRARLHGDRVDLMVHEPYLPFRRDLSKHNAVALAHRVMTAILVNSACRVWMSTPAWEARWRPYALGRRIAFGWLPIPSTVPVLEDPQAAAAVRVRYTPAGGFLVGHLGTYGPPIAALLLGVLPKLMRIHSKPTVLLLGRGGREMRAELIRHDPELADRVHATGPLDAPSLSRHVRACDVLVQPYPDGVTTRRTTVMAALAHGVPVVTTAGELTEPLWTESGAVALTAVGDGDSMARVTADLLAEKSERIRLGTLGKALYRDRFEIGHTIAALRAAS
jgi:glycosyltransferase involved in cell wall biosynthesis